MLSQILNQTSTSPLKKKTKKNLSISALMRGSEDAANLAASWLGGSPALVLVSPESGLGLSRRWDWPRNGDVNRGGLAISHIFYRAGKADNE